MPRPTIYLNEEEDQYLQKLGNSRSGAIRELVRRNREERLSWYRCEAHGADDDERDYDKECGRMFRAHEGAEICPYCGYEAGVDRV